MHTTFSSRIFLVILLLMSTQTQLNAHSSTHKKTIRKHKHIAQVINGVGVLTSTICAVLARNSNKLGIHNTRYTHFLKRSSNISLFASWLLAIGYDFSKTEDGFFSVACDQTVQTVLTTLGADILSSFVEHCFI